MIHFSGAGSFPQWRRVLAHNCRHGFNAAVTPGRLSFPKPSHTQSAQMKTGRFGSPRLTRSLFRTHIAGRSHHRALDGRIAGGSSVERVTSVGPIQPPAWQRACAAQAESKSSPPAVFRQHYVFRLQIPMNDPGRMSSGQPVRNLRCNVNQFAWRNRIREQQKDAATRPQSAR